MLVKHNLPICQRQHRQEREKEREEREKRGAKEGATGGFCYQRRRRGGDAGAGVVEGKERKMGWRGKERGREMKIGCPQLRFLAGAQRCSMLTLSSVLI